MVLRYTGRTFREAHHIGLRELARMAGLRSATLIDLELQRRVASTETVARIMTAFRARGIACAVSDLLTYEEQEEPDGQRDDARE